MSIVPILVVVAAVILVMYFLMNKKSDDQEREGLVKDILQKDALAIDFGDGRRVVVRLSGLTPATEGEMLDEKIFQFLEETLRGQRVSVKPIVVDSPELMRAEVRTLGGEYVNAVMVRHGFARWNATEAAGDAELGEAQQMAQAEHLGVWNPAIIQLLEDRRKSAEGSELSDEEIANMQVDPEEQESKES
ncbi:thermonuclease family protein [Pelagicoccus mobilis]|uniref:Thermonuclease family protein n=1 Tax=Pelagicoccus mobilis TaxID=415221 RepID=A0A934RQH0_9BACT|nr:thermonuclease family protein [Pelagicoccus mobilis]MBK1875650.1 thermonuclease family protein [Pelagicoccus mobilis]